jgi:hypothetical protein
VWTVIETVIARAEASGCAAFGGMPAHEKVTSAAAAMTMRAAERIPADGIAGA